MWRKGGVDSIRYGRYVVYLLFICLIIFTPFSKVTTVELASYKGPPPHAPPPHAPPPHAPPPHAPPPHAPPPHARIPPNVSISPQILTGPPGWINVNDTFTINVTISNVIDLFYWQAGLSFNPTVLECINFTEGTFLKAGGDTVWQPGAIDNNEGFVTPHGATSTWENGVSGDGILASIAFKVKDAGRSELRLREVLLLDSDYEEIKPVILIHGNFQLSLDPEPRPPNAYFFYYPSTPSVNEMVMFNASGSTPGGHIETYEWNFDDGTQDQGIFVNHIFVYSGEYNVTLIVTDDQNLTDSFSRLVKVLPLLQGTSIDIYTQRDGKGLNKSSDAFAPQELIIATVHLTNNGTPVIGELVTFELYHANGTMIWSSVSVTEDDGFAFTAHMIRSSPDFGMYRFIARASVGGEVVSDTLWLRVGWLIEILEVIPCDGNCLAKTQFEIGEPLFLLAKIKNIRSYHTSLTLTSIVLDETMQLILMKMDKYTASPNETMTFHLCLDAIPEWTRVGNSTVHAGVLQWSGGPAFCPSASSCLTITIPVPNIVMVEVTVPSSLISSGQQVNITISVLNEYYRSQTFNVTIYANTTIIQTLTIIDLVPYTQTNFTSEWDTNSIFPGNYVISAEASIVPNEINTTDNIYVGNMVQIIGFDGFGGSVRPLMK